MTCRMVAKQHDLPRPSRHLWKKGAVVCCRDCGSIFRINNRDLIGDVLYEWVKVTEIPIIKE